MSSKVKRFIDVVVEIEAAEAVAFEEGGEWSYCFQENDMVHAIRLNGGRIWDAVNGWRTESNERASSWLH